MSRKNQSAEQSPVIKAADEAVEHRADILNYRFENPDMESQVHLFCGDDEELFNHFKSALYYSNKFPSKKFSVTIKKHNDTEGNFNITIKSLMAGIPDVSELTPGRYMSILKYFDPTLPVKGGKLSARGTWATISRIFVIGQERVPESPVKPSQTALMGPGINSLSEFKEIYAECSTIMSETLKMQLETITRRKEIESKGYAEGIEAGKLLKENEFLKAQIEAIQSAPAAESSGIMEMLNQLTGGKLTEILKNIPGAGNGLDKAPA